MNGWDRANEEFSSNLDEYMDQYGRFAGLETDDEIDVVREKYANDQVTIPSEDWDEDHLDNQFEILEMWEEHGIIEDAPSREQGMTYSELEDLAEE